MSPDPQGWSSRLRAIGAVLRDHRDVLAGRVVTPAPPPWCRDRGWDAFLLGLDARELERAEEQGLEAMLGERADTPESLRSLAAEVARLTAVDDAPVPPPTVLPGVRARKRVQVASLLQLCATEQLSPARIVDVGSGHGHLGRALAAALGVPALGIERDAGRIRAARALATATERYEEVQVTAERLSFTPGDLAVGLHACGDLGDALVVAAARDGVDTLLVSCCLQKTRAQERTFLSVRGRSIGLVLPREVLGLSNLVARSSGVETSMGAIQRARQTRHALHGLLRARGIEVERGEEARGINRRRFQRGLGPVAEHALRARGLAPPTEAEIRLHESRAAEEHGALRRLSLPRSVLGRAVELAVVLDRAAFLEEAGHAVQVRAVFPAEASPRNIGILARGQW